MCDFSEKEEAKKAFESTINVQRVLLNTFGLWPYDIKEKKDRITAKDNVLWVIRSITIVYNSISFVTELMYITLLANNMFEILESMASFAINLFYTAVTYNFYLRRDEIKYVIDMLQSIIYSKFDRKNGCRMVIEYSRKVKMITFSLWMFTGLATIVFMTIPFWSDTPYANLGVNVTVRRPLPYHSWYPYDTNKNPNYAISFTLEFFRGIGILNIISGNDGLFTLILFYTFGQYEILCENFENVFEDARNKLRKIYANQHLDENRNSEEYQRLLYKEAKYLLKENIKHHYALNDLCVKEEEVYGPMIFIHVVLHAAVSCFVGYLLMMSINNNDLWNTLKYVLAEIVLLIELFVYGFVGSQLIITSSRVSDGCFYSEWYSIPDQDYKSSVLMVMHRAQNPCKLTALKFTVLSLEFVVTVFSSAASYFTLLNAIKET